MTIIPTHNIPSETEVIITWSESDSDDILEYIVNVREYSMRGGSDRVLMDSIDGYPLLTTDKEHTVKSLGKIY